MECGRRVNLSCSEVSRTAKYVIFNKNIVINHKNTQTIIYCTIIQCQTKC